MTNDVAELARVTCEEYYTEPAYGMDPDCDPDLAREARMIDDAEEAAAQEPEPECFACGGYGYLGVRDELCTVCIGPRVHVREAGEYVVFELSSDRRDWTAVLVRGH